MDVVLLLQRAESGAHLSALWHQPAIRSAELTPKPCLFVMHGFQALSGNGPRLVRNVDEGRFVL